MELPSEVEKFLAEQTELTAKAYRTDLVQLARYLYPISLLGADLADLRGWMGGLQGNGLKPKTIQRKCHAAKSLYTWLWQENVLPSNIGAKLRVPKAASEETPRYLSPDEVKAIIENCRPGKDRLLAKALYGLGCRVSELVNLEAADLRDGQRVRLLGKGKRERIVPCPDWVWGELLSLARETGPGRKLFGFTRQQAWEVIHNAGVRSGLRAMPHSLRHCHASHAIAAGADLQTVRSQLGHASLETVSIYAHCQKERSSSADFLGFK